VKWLRSPLAWVLIFFGSAMLGCTPESRGSGSGGSGGAGNNDGWGDRTDIQAIFENACSGCHSTQFSSCWDVQSDTPSIEGAVSSGFMPRGAPLSPSDKQSLLHWLRDGADCSGKRPDGSGGGGGGGGSIGSGVPIHY
jgi:hypothetical protein